MNQDEAIQLAIRQVKDIQVQAEKIVKGDKSNSAIQSFATYSVQLIDFIDQNIPSDEIKRYLKELPFVTYKPKYSTFWQYLIWPTWWITLYKDNNSKNKVIAEINDAQQKYLNLELLLKGLTG
ncbi:MAG TPA: hypothetical protein VIT44_19365 [Cyclobacteriaceae bacterium]